jgi:small GTP-binding protein
MNDLDRIKEIERIFGFPLHRVEKLEQLTTEKVFESDDSDTTRNYCLDEKGNVIGLSLDFSPVYLLPNGFLTAFSQIKQLSLKNDLLTDVSFLKELKSHTSLDLGDNELTISSFLREMKSLTSLNLRNNHLTDVSFLKELKSLTSLDLSVNELTDVSFLKELKSLTSLDLSYNQLLTDVSDLKELKSLTSLILNFNKLINVRFLKELKNLTSLDLSSNQLTDVSFLKELKNLTSLDLSSNQLTDVSFLKELIRLTSLDLSSNQLTNVIFPEGLKSLNSLDLGYNELTNVIFSEGLKSLNSLDLSYNQLTDVSFLKELKSLSSLDLRSNQLTDVSVLKGLKSPTSLDLSSNQLTDVSVLKGLKSLTSLDLSSNQLTDVSFLKELKNLTYLDLQGNRISTLPEWITDLPLKIDLEISLFGYDLFVKEGNPIETPPLEVVKRGREAIRNYFQQIKKGEDYLYEAKLLLVGEERAGKSTIADALSNSEYIFDKDKKTTEGIDILEWNIPKEKIGTPKDFKFNIWDFGGQEIYHATHQFFLTKRSLYLFVTEARKDLRFDDFYYWLNIIKTLAGNSPIISVQNKADQSHENSSIDEYCKIYPQLFPELQIISCNDQHNDWEKIYSKKLDLLKENIYKIIKNSSHKKQMPDDRLIQGIGSPLPKDWVKIRDEIKLLQNENINHISLTDYYSICEKYELDNKQALHLSDYFHDLGVFLHFQKDIQLKDIIFLNHQWVTKAIYNVFDCQKVKDAYGKFTEKDLMEIWDEPEFANNQAQLLNLLKNPKFKICYQHENDYYLAPQLFQDKPLKYEWRTYEDNLSFRYEYEFMPKGILSQLIVMLHKYIYKDTHWKYGVLFEYKNSRAIVTEDRYSRKNRINIRTEGNEKKELLSTILLKIEEINKTFTNLEPHEMLGCNCSECIQSPEKQYFFSMETINKRINKGKKVIECEKSIEVVEIDRLLGIFLSPKQLDAQLKNPIGTITNNIINKNTFIIRKVERSILGSEIKDSEIDYQGE